MAILSHRGRRVVQAITDRWIVEDEWWRKPIDRHYYALLLADGSTRTIYHDRVANQWFAQTY